MTGIIPNQPKALVTGGAGFLGSHLCRRLLHDGYFVTCLDNFFTGSKRNIADLIEVENFQLVEGDVIDSVIGEYDEIYNLACPASPIHYQENPVATLRTSVLGMMNVLELARKTGAKVLHASTSEIYGDPLVHPQVESYWGNVNTIGVRSCYDEGKRCAETLASDYRRMYGVDVRMVRIFNTYGPNMHPEDGRVVSNFICQALRNEPLTVYGDGLQTRSFQYADDLIEAMRRLMKLADAPLVVNIGNPSEFTMLELAEKVKALIPESTSVIVHEALPGDDPKKRKPDISLAKRLLDWEPKVPLEDGLAKTIAYFRTIIGSNR